MKKKKKFTNKPATCSSVVADRPTSKTKESQQPFFENE